MKDAMYLKRHKMVRRERGPASEQSCVDCGKQARDWSQMHGNDGESVLDYEPRCRRCHVAYDGIGINPGMAVKGSKLSAETRAKMSASRMGKKRGPYQIGRRTGKESV